MLAAISQFGQSCLNTGNIPVHGLFLVPADLLLLQFVHVLPDFFKFGLEATGLLDQPLLDCQLVVVQVLAVVFDHSLNLVDLLVGGDNWLNNVIVVLTDLFESLREPI